MKFKVLKKIEEVLSKDIKDKSLVEVVEELKNRAKQASTFIEKKNWEDFSLLEKIKFLMLLGLGRDRTIACIPEYKINRDDIKSTRESMNEEETAFRLESESIITRKKIDSTKRSKRLEYFKEQKLNWEELTKRYLAGEPLNKLAKEYNVKVNYVTEQLKDDGTHDESRSTLLKNKRATELKNAIDDNFIIQLVKNNPLDGKYALWEKAKEEYPWLLRKQMFEKLTELGLEKTEAEVNRLRGIRNKEGLQNITEIDFDKKIANKDIKKIAKDNPLAGKRALSKIIKKEFPHVKMRAIEEKIEGLDLGNKNVISAQMTKANTMKKIEETFGSLENLVYLYMKNTLGSYSKIAKKINEKYKEDENHIEVSTRQVEKAITRHHAYVPRQSYPERQLLEFVKKSFPNCTVKREALIPGTMKRIDVFIEELQVGIEFNGDYYHSDEVILHNYGKTAENHHKERVDEAAIHEIKLVYVWERDWNENYSEIERAIVNRDWDNPILNRYSNSNYHRRVKPPKAQNSNSKTK